MEQKNIVLVLDDPINMAPSQTFFSEISRSFLVEAFLRKQSDYRSHKLLQDLFQKFRILDRGQLFISMKYGLAS